MMSFSKPITEIIPQRYSCRTYTDRPIEAEVRQRLADFLAASGSGPLGTPARFELIAATEEDRQSLRGLGAYGLIRGATGFIVGAAGNGEKNLEDFGYLMERAILLATDLGLGTCWIGGIFTKSSFARKIAVTDGEMVPAVTATGYAQEGSRSTDLIRLQAGSDRRQPWESLFFQGKFGNPISLEDAGRYATPLEMVRIGPSASNKQPWRIVRSGNAWHFYLQRTKRYGRGSLIFTLLRLADLQRVDMGIAMCHFALTANELGLKGRWIISEPEIDKPDDTVEYIVSWVETYTENRLQ
jgi:nitroreductase